MKQAVSVLALAASLWLSLLPVRVPAAQAREAFSRAAAAGETAVEAQRIEQLADQFDAAAAQLRRDPHATLWFEGGTATTTSRQSALDRWLAAAVAEIKSQRSARAQANELRETAASLRGILGSQQAARPTRDVESEASSILAQRDYQVKGGGQAPAPRETLWQRFLGWLGGLLNRLFGGIFRAANAVPLVGEIVAIALIAAFVAAIALIVVRLYGVIAKRKRLPSADAGSPLPERLDPDALHARGVEAAAAGDYARAIALLFQASLAAFDRSGCILFDPSLTPGEYRRAVARRLASASGDFDRVANAFVLAAFAERRVSQDDWSSTAAAFSNLRSLAAA